MVGMGEGQINLGSGTIERRTFAQGLGFFEAIHEFPSMSRERFLMYLCFFVNASGCGAGYWVL